MQDSTLKVDGGVPRAPSIGNEIRELHLYVIRDSRDWIGTSRAPQDLDPISQKAYDISNFQSGITAMVDTEGQKIRRRVWLADVRYNCPVCARAQSVSFEVNRVQPDETEVRESHFGRLRCECGLALTADIKRENFIACIVIKRLNSEEGEAPVAIFDDVEVYLEDGILTHPYDAFMESWGDCSRLLRDSGSNNGDDILNRMIFAQHISNLEAYLSESLIAGIKHKPALQAKLVFADRELRDKSFHLSDIMQSRDEFVQNEIINHLRSLIYHNMGRIEPLYRLVFDFEIFTSKEIRAFIEKAIHYRHDCVHRSGRDKLGRKLMVFSKSYLEEIADKVHDLVFHIEWELPEPIEDEDAWMVDLS